MKVLFLSRSTLYTTKGGDTTQIVQTARALKDLGVEVDIKLSGDAVMYEDYDLIHFFNLIRPADILPHLKQTKKPFVISSIYVDYSVFDQNERKGFAGALSHLLGKHGAEYAKTLLRALKGQDPLHSWKYLLGHKYAMKQAIARAELLLPNSEHEATRICEDLKIDFKYRTIPNGVDTELFFEDDTVLRKSNQVLCVGQIEGRKNQHRLIQACQALEADLVIIGKPSPNNVSYYEHCKSIAGAHVQFIDFLPQEELRKWYQESAVHALPSWFETTGLSSLEAAACGCNLVVSSAGDTVDYFDGFASFCEANSTESIQAALKEALSNSAKPTMAEQIKKHYTWKEAANQTLKAYNTILK